MRSPNSSMAAPFAYLISPKRLTSCASSSLCQSVGEEPAPPRFHDNSHIIHHANYINIYLYLSISIALFPDPGSRFEQTLADMKPLST